jgi:hypothetical protein
MTTRFAQQFKRIGAPSLLRQFGETITYIPRAGGITRSIAARIVRNDPQTIAELGDVTGQNIVVTVLNDAVKGILSTEIDSGGDKVRIALETDGDIKVRSIVKVLSDANGQVSFLVQ